MKSNLPKMPYFPFLIVLFLDQQKVALFHHCVNSNITFLNRLLQSIFISLSSFASQHLSIIIYLFDVSPSLGISSMKVHFCLLYPQHVKYRRLRYRDITCPKFQLQFNLFPFQIFRLLGSIVFLSITKYKIIKIIKITNILK